MKNKLLFGVTFLTQVSIAQIYPYSNTINNTTLQNSSLGGYNLISGTTSTGQTTSGCLTSGYTNVVKYNTGSTKQPSNSAHALGNQCIVGGASSFAMGLRTMAGTDDNSLVSGTASNVLKNNAFAIGRDVTVYAENAFAIGSGLYSSNHSADLVNSKNNSLVIAFNHNVEARSTFFVGEPNISNASAWDDYGTVGIGTNDTKGHTLGVRGDIIAEKMMVSLYSTPWPDYVFKPTYKLTPLSELEKEIKILGHLPHIPSADVIEKNGYDMAEMDAMLLRKVEELTLYIIELKKENDQLRETILNK